MNVKLNFLGTFTERISSDCPLTGTLHVAFLVLKKM